MHRLPAVIWHFCPDAQAGSVLRLPLLAVVGRKVVVRVFDSVSPLFFDRAILFFLLSPLSSRDGMKYRLFGGNMPNAMKARHQRVWRVASYIYVDPGMLIL